MRTCATLPPESFAALRDVLERGFAASGNWRLARAHRALRGIERYLRRPLRIAILGEQNSGKSSLINMLLRASVAPTGALSGVRTHLLLRYGAENAAFAVAPDGARARLTSKALAKMAVPEIQQATLRTNIIYNASDPAAAAPHRDFPRPDLMPGPLAGSEGAPKLIELTLPHAFLKGAELIESRLVPQPGETTLLLQRAFTPVDLAIWCTLATQAWKETERQAWRRFPISVSRNAILLVTYRDAIGAKDEAKLITRLRRDTGPLFGDIFLLSLRRATEAITSGGHIADAGRWERSGAADFEMALQSRLVELDHRRSAKSASCLRRLAAAVAEAGKADLPAALADGIALHFGWLISVLEQHAGPVQNLSVNKDI